MGIGRERIDRDRRKEGNEGGGCGRQEERVSGLCQAEGDGGGSGDAGGGAGGRWVPVVGKLRRRMVDCEIMLCSGLCRIWIMCT